MAAEESVETTDAADGASAKSSGMLVWILVMVLAAAGGFAVPYVLAQINSDPESETQRSAAGQSAGEQSSKQDFITFGEVTVNLNEGRFNRYLRMNFTLQVDSQEKEEVAKLIEERRVVLKNWLISHLSDKNMEDIRGAAGQNMLRREILEEFNTELFPGGYDRIYDVLFEDFNVQ